MAKLCFACLCFFLFVLLLTPVAGQESQQEEPQQPPDQPAPAAIQWEPTYAAALKKAREANKPLLIYLYEPGKKLCEYVENNILAAPDVVKYTENFVCYKEERKKEQGVAPKFRLLVAPLVAIISSENERPIGNILENFQWQEFLEKLKAVFDSIAVEKETREKFSQSPDDVEVNFKLAEVWMTRGHPDRAIQFYERVVRVDPKDEKGFTVDAALKLAELYLDTGKIDAARKSLKKAKEADPEDKKGTKEVCALQEAKILVQFESRYDEAITALTNFISAFPESKSLADVYFLLGYTYYMKDDYENAITYWEIVVSKFPEHELTDKAKGFIEIAKQESGKKKRK